MKNTNSNNKKKLNKKQVEDGAITGRQAAAGTHNGTPYYIFLS
jgi:hypothetical protein